MRFQNGFNKVVIELSGVQFWSQIILVISNRTRAARSFEYDFRPNCTPLSSITIINLFLFFLFNFLPGFISNVERIY